MEPDPKQRKPQRKKRTFTDEFKAGAVRLVIEEGKTVTDVAKGLDLVQSALSKWVERGTLTTDEKEELSRLRKEVRTLRVERDILKKAAAFFAKENA